MKKELPIVILFSGGRTSAFMTKFLMEHSEFKKREKIICFANTGKEMEATLEFVNECDQRWGLNVKWLEASVNPEKGKATLFKIVTFETASRKGEPFEAVISKYGIPNKQWPHCTRELKQVPIRKYIQSLGYQEWIMAIGIRADESHRINPKLNPSYTNTFYPLNDLIKVDKHFIRNWWVRQDFDLKLKDYQGNCDLCWKKSKRKRLTLISENSSIINWWSEMELMYGNERDLFDQRDGISIVELVEMAKKPFTKIRDEYELKQNTPLLFEPEMDMEWECFCKSS